MVHQSTTGIGEEDSGVRAGLQRNGFAILESILSSSELRKATAALIARGENASRRLLDEEFWQETAKLVATRVPCLSALRPVLATYFPKSKSNNWFVAMHRDWVLPVAPFGEHWEFEQRTTKEGIAFGRAPQTLLEQCVALRLQLDGGSEGGLEVYPGSHQLTNGSDTSSQPRIQVAVQPAGALLMKPLLLHASPKVLDGESIRRIVHIVFAPEGGGEPGSPPFDRCHHVRQ